MGMEDSFGKKPTPQGQEAMKKAELKQPGYFSKVARVFNKLIQTNIEYSSHEEEKDKEEFFEQNDFFQEKMKDLQKLDKPNASKEIYPEEVAEALATAFATMAYYQNTDVENFSESDMREYEKNYNDARSVFMEGAGKLYPGIKVSLNIENLQSLASKLHFEDESTNNTKELHIMLNERPKDLLEYLNKRIDDLGGVLRGQAEINHNFDDFSEREAENLKLSEQIELAYQVQLLRDELQKQIYNGN